MEIKKGSFKLIKVTDFGTVKSSKNVNIAKKENEKKYFDYFGYEIRIKKDE